MIWRFTRFTAIGMLAAWTISGRASAIGSSADIAFASRRDGNWEI